MGTLKTRANKLTYIMSQSATEFSNFSGIVCSSPVEKSLLSRQALSFKIAGVHSSLERSVIIPVKYLWMVFISLMYLQF